MIRTILVSLGHDEYTIGDAAIVVDRVWQPHSDDLLDTVPVSSGDGTGDSVRALFQAITAHTYEDITSVDWDVDLMWENVARVTGTDEHLLAALDTLIVDLAADPGGDDGTFDYWPSGVRLARAMAKALGVNKDRDLERVAQTVIMDTTRSEHADELYAKIGFDRPDEVSLDPNAVFVLITYNMDGTVADVEVFSTRPRFALNDTQDLRVANINGGDSSYIEHHSQDAYVAGLRTRG